jgi:altronate hydrolase
VTHPYGCSQLGEDFENTQKLLASLIKHPNAGGVLVLGLGCENNNIAEFKKVLGEVDRERIKFLSLQETEDDIAEALSMICQIYNVAKNDRRTVCPMSGIVLGLKCGGSDGYSGITANSLVGEVSDIICGSGGSSILTEVPEMFGSETILMERCKDEATFEKMVSLINDFKDYYAFNNLPCNENPSPGNKEGGITTLEEKSLGCTNKAGQAEVVDVLRYGQKQKEMGLNVLEAPGNDIVATTALTAAGANLIVFTTGRGTPFGGIVPTLKVSSNNVLAKNKPGWIDLNAGEMLEGKQLAKALIDLIIETASGKLTKNEINGYKEVAIFKKGVTL